MLPVRSYPNRNRWLRGVGRLRLPWLGPASRIGRHPRGHPPAAAPAQPGAARLARRPLPAFVAALSRGPALPGPARPARLGPLPRAAHRSPLARPAAGTPRPLRRRLPGQAQRRAELDGPAAPLPDRAPGPGLAARLPARARPDRPARLRRRALRAPAPPVRPRAARPGQRRRPVPARPAPCNLHPPGTARRAAGQLRRRHLARHQAHPRLGQGEQPQSLRRRALRQDPASPRAIRTASWAARNATTQGDGPRRRRDRHGRRHAGCPGATAPGHAPRRPTDPVPASQASVGEFYWGYASGVVTTKVPDWGEFVLAELTQTFDHGDATYFFPLMAQTTQRLGRQPRFGALDKAYDAFYVYQYFHDAGGFAAVPLVAKGRADAAPVQPRGLAPLRRRPGHAAQVHLHRPHHHPRRPRTRQVRLSAGLAHPPARRAPARSPTPTGPRAAPP